MRVDDGGGGGGSGGEGGGGGRQLVSREVPVWLMHQLRPCITQHVILRSCYYFIILSLFLFNIIFF